jgi:hypothetical protein
MVRDDLDDAQVLLADLENTSQESYEFRDGQERYFAREGLEEAVDAWRLTNSIAAVTSAAIIAATVPVGGPVDVSIATLNGIHASILALGAAAKEDLQDILAPHFYETEIFQLSFRSGKLAFYANPSFAYGGVAGAALEVVEDDGVTAYHVP